MSEGNVEVSCARKRGRDHSIEDMELHQHKKSGGLCPWSDLFGFESSDVEEDLPYSIDEERVSDLMRELMEELGMVPPPHHALIPPLESWAETSCSWCDSASSCNHCFSKNADARATALAAEMDSAQSAVNGRDCFDYEGALLVSEYSGEIDLSADFSEDGIFINDNDLVEVSVRGPSCGLTTTFSGEELWQFDGTAQDSSDFLFEGEAIENRVLEETPWQ